MFGCDSVVRELQRQIEKNEKRFRNSEKEKDNNKQTDDPKCELGENRDSTEKSRQERMFIYESIVILLNLV